MDFEQINEVIGLASNAVGMTSRAAATINSIKGLIEGEKKTDRGEAAELLNTLATQLTAANMTNVQLSEALRALSRELQKENEFEKVKARYELFETEAGDLVFRLKNDMANGEPIHFVCPVCLNTEKLISYVTGDETYKHCQTTNGHGFRFRRVHRR
ncbi:MAG: hypothetical protein RID23_19560 [Roseovarius sp.]